jgi:autotransporter-associated beta strand protein
MMEGSNTYTDATTVDSGATLSGAAGANVFSAVSATTVSGTLDLGGNDQAVGSLSGAGVVTNSGASGTATLTNQGASSEFDGVIQDGATATTALTQNAPLGTLTLTGTNTYTGATTIDAGTLALSGAGAVADSSGVSLATGSVFDISQSTLSAPPGVQIMALGNTAAGQTGTVYLGAQTLTLTGALTTFGGVIADAGGINSVTGGGLTLASTATGVETLTGVNTYTGATTIDAGTLALSGAGSIADSSGVSLATGSVFDISQSTLSAPPGVQIMALGNTAAGQTGTVYLGAQTLTLTGALTTFGGVIADAGGINSVTGGGLTLASTATGTETLTGVNTYTGATTVNAGTLALSGTGSVASSSGVFIAAGGVFDISQTTAGASITTLADTPSSPANGAVSLGSQTLTITAGSTTFSGVIQDGGIGGGTGGGLSIAGGAQTLAGVNTYTGATTIDATAKLALSGLGSIASSSGVVDNGTFDISGLTPSGTSVATITTLSGAGAVTLGANTLTLSNASGTFSGGISGTGGFTLAAGAETLAGTNTYTGPTNINGGTLNVTGSIGSTGTPTGAINVAPGAALNDSGSIVSGGLLTNAGAIYVAPSGALTAMGGLNNASTGTIVNMGTITDDLSNAGTVTNYGVYNANVASNTGAITNEAAGTWNGAVNQYANVAGGVITNLGTWNGTALSYNDGGTIDNQGTWSGGIQNDSGVFTNEGTLSGGLIANGGVSTNSGTINGGATVTGGTLNNTPSGTISGGVALAGNGPAIVNALGVINGGVTSSNPNAIFNVGDAAQTPPTGPKSQVLTVNGSIAGLGGPSSPMLASMPVNLTTGASNYVQVNGGSVSNAQINLTGTLTNPKNQLWSVPNQTLLYSNVSFPLSAASNQLLEGAGRYGLFDYVPTPGNNGIAQELKLGVVSSPANQISALITGLNTSFFQNASAFLGSPQNPTANMWYGGVWTRGGGAEMTTETTTTGGGVLYPGSVDTRYQTSTGGVQFGIDEGLYNINASGMNAHLGVTGGQAWGYSTLNRSSDPNALLNVSGSAGMPFYGLYAAVTGQSFSGTVQWRHSTFDMNLNNTDLGLNNAALNAYGDTFSADAAYTLPLAYNFFVTPSAAVFVSNTRINNLYASPLVAPGTWFTFDNLNNTLFRAGVRLGTVYGYNDNLLVQPYVAGNVWHEFDGTTTAHFYQLSSAGLSTLPGIYSTGVGTFGQFAVGFSTQSPKSGVTSYVQADLRTGSNIQGWGLSAGLRYSY